jgi:hypothetical protein
MSAMREKSISSFRAPPRHFIPQGQNAENGLFQKTR